MEFCNCYKITPVRSLLQKLYNINYKRNHANKPYIERIQKCKILAGEALIGNKEYIETYSANGKDVQNIQVKSFSKPLLYRYADEEIDSFRIDSAYLEKLKINSYQLIAEIVDIVRYFNPDGSVKNEFINSDIIVGCDYDDG